MILFRGILLYPLLRALQLYSFREQRRTEQTDAGKSGHNEVERFVRP